MNKEVKVLLSLEDLLDDNSKGLYDECHIVQHFSYESKRIRNNPKEIQWTEDSMLLSVSIRIMSSETGKILFKRMKEQEQYAYSFIFNGSFDDNNRLKSYDDMMVAKGYIVDLEEIFTNVESTEGTTEQMLLNVQLLLNSITFVGTNNNLEITV